jgi:hypothetical protein
MGGGSPGVTVTGSFGEAGLGEIRISGESHRGPQNALWLGGGTLGINRIDYSVVGSASRPSTSGLIQDITLSAETELNGGRLDMHESIAVGRIAAGGQTLGPASLALALNNLPPEPLAEFNRLYRSAASSASDPQQQSESMQRELYEMLAAVVKQSPVFSLDLRVSSPNGKAVGTAKFQLAPELANDPLFKPGNPDRRGMMAAAWNKYGDAAVDFEAPATLIDQVAKPDQIRQLEQNGILVRDGSKYVSRASFRTGGWLVNGRKVQLPAAAPCPAPCTNRS